MKKKFCITGLIFASSFAMGQEKVIKLQESVITSENSEATIADIPKNITVVTQEEMVASGAQTVGDAVRSVSSVTVKKLSGSDAAFDMRGLGSSNVIILLDGVPLNSIDSSGAKTSQIPIDQVEKIEVIPSGGAVLYGDSAIGGVINIIRKTPENKKNYGKIGVEFGSYGMHKEEIVAGTKVGDRFLIETEYSNKKKDGYRSYEKNDLETFGIRTDYILNSGNLGFKYNYSKSEFKAPGSLTESKIDEDRRQAGLSLLKGNLETNDFGADYTYNFNSALEFKLLGTYRENNYNSHTINKEYDSSWDYNYKTKILYLKPQVKYSYADESYVVVGMDFNNAETKTDDGIIKNKTVEKDSVAGYVLNNFRYEDFKFTQGYRREHIKYKNVKDNTDPSITDKFMNKNFNSDVFEFTVSYLYSDTGSTYIGYTRGFRTPNTDELGYWTNKEFKKQNSDTYELGIKDFIGNTYMSGSLFYIKTNNEIVFGEDNFGNDRNYNLEGTTKRKGVELSFEHYFDKLTISESATYMHTENNNGKKIPGVPNIKGVLNFSYKVTEKLTANNSWEYYGKMYANTDDDNTAGKVDSYIVTGISLNYVLGNGLVINAGIDNLFNEKYYDYVGYNEPKPWDNGGKFYYPAPERNYYIGFKYSF